MKTVGTGRRKIMTVYLSEYIDPGARKLLEENAVVVSDFEKIEEIDAIILRNIPVTAEMMAFVFVLLFTVTVFY